MYVNVAASTRLRGNVFVDWTECRSDVMVVASLGRFACRAGTVGRVANLTKSMEALKSFKTASAKHGPFIEMLQ